MKPLDGRSAVITGASRGIGLAIAHAYVEAGASVTICAREEEALGRAAAELERPGRPVVAQVADSSDLAAMEALVAAAGEPAIVVANAGVQGPIGPFEEADWAQWRRTVEIDLFGPAALARAAIPAMKRAGYGKILMLAGGGASSARPMLSAYAAAKVAIVRLAETLAAELAGDRIDVNAMAPGAINTRMHQEVLSAGADRAGSAEYEAAMQREREGGASPENAAALAVWLGSAASDGVSGRLISAVWDEWDALVGSELGEDVFTLRRVTP